MGALDCGKYVCLPSKQLDASEGCYEYFQKRAVDGRGNAFINSHILLNFGTEQKVIEQK